MPLPRQDNSNRGHLDFLDGLRGIAALYVVLYHSISISIHGNGRTIPFMFRPLMLGFIAVMIFIVLSGFCLMLPVVRSSELALRGGLRTFLLRRARRILPPYYAALAASFILPILITLLKTHHRPQHWLMPWCRYGGRYDLLAHIALVHNLWSAWAQNILPPLWSVATEWQIYFLFALLLLPVLRRWGTFAALAASVVISLGPSYLLRTSHNLAWACPWLVILFAVGMIGAVIAETPGNSPNPWRKALLYRLALPCLVLLLVPASLSTPAWFAWWKLDIVFGLLTIWFILAAYHQAPASPFWTPRRLLELRPVVALGRFSYSLYLTHYLVLAGVVLKTASYHLSPTRQACLNLIVGTPLAVGCAWMFYLVFERPFLNKPVASATETTGAATNNSSVTL